jgi:hypothetical protein
LTYGIPVLSDLLAWSGAQPRGARRAERWGRSGGPGQSRPRHGRCSGRNSPFSFLHSSTSSLPPRVIGWRHPLPFRARLAGPLHHGIRLRHSRPEGRRDFLPPQRTTSVLDGHAAVPPFAHQHFALGWRVGATSLFELEKPAVVPHHPVLADRALALQPENPVQFSSARHTSEGPAKTTNVYMQKLWCRRRDLNPHSLAATGF